MASFSRDGLLRSFVLAGAVLSLGACAVTSPIDVTSAGPGVASIDAIRLQSAASEEAQRAAFEAALHRALANSSIRLDKDAPYLGDFAIALRDARTGLAEPQDTTGESGQVDWASDPRKRRLFDGCKAKRIRATLVILSRESGAIVYRGEGEADACGFTEKDYDRLAARLVEDALGRGQQQPAG
ncbi:MAG: hypothetical protein KDD90_07930 [Sphingomonadaceae bacterium]|jgi:hypothetical protein|nr:hypothetical protein [Sphingomonadaceae bacterium]